MLLLKVRVSTYRHMVQIGCQKFLTRNRGWTGMLLEITEVDRMKRQTSASMKTNRLSFDSSFD